MKLALGTGTGRCGTKSLRILCMAQPDCGVTHERFYLPWYDGAGVELQDALAEWQRVSAGVQPYEEAWENGALVRGAWGSAEKIAGDIGPWYLPVVPFLVAQHGARIIHLERDRETYVESALRGPWDCFSEQPAPDDQPGEPYAYCVPKYDAPREQATGMFWDTVHDLALHYADAYPDNFRAWSMWALDSQAEQLEMMKWIGVEQPVALDSYPDRAENRLAKVGP